MDFQKEYECRLAVVNERLSEILNSDKNSRFSEEIVEAMNYSLLSGGKRIRPIILMEGCKINSVYDEIAIDFACALEMIHTYSLIHDDLPAMDNDDYRRGKLSSHKKFGEDMAILAGDALLNGAFEVMIDSIIVHGRNENFKKYILAMKKIAESSGYRGMILGQVSDIKSFEITDSSDLDYINKNKTGAIIESAFSIGSIISENMESQKKFQKVGELFGNAFQIQDDVLDIIGDFDKLGKPVGSDSKNKKSTYADIFGVEKAKNKYIMMYNECIDLLNSVENAEFLVEMIRNISNREK